MEKQPRAIEQRYLEINQTVERSVKLSSSLRLEKELRERLKGQK